MPGVSLAQPITEPPGKCSRFWLRRAWLPPVALLPALVHSPSLPPGRGAELAWWLSASAGAWGLGLVVLLLLAALRPRPAQWPWLLLPLALVLINAAWLNEHLLKPAVGAPRPNLVWLAGQRRGPLPEGVAAFYASGDAATRSRELAQRLAAHPQGLSQRVRRHWIQQTGFSFPSGHSLAAALVGGWFLYWIGCLGRARALAPGPMLWVAAVGWSRLILGVHRPVDVLAGLLLGLALSVLTAALVHRWWRRAASGR